MADLTQPHWKKNPLFRDLLVNDLELVSMLFEEIFFPAGQPLFHQGDEAKSLYLVESGEIQILKELTPGQPGVEIARLPPGEVLGEMALVRDCRRSCTAVTAQPSGLQVLRKEKLATLMHRDLRVFAQLAFNIAGILATRLEKMDEILSHKGKEEVAPRGLFGRLFGTS